MLEKSKSFREKKYTFTETVVNNEERVDFLIAKPAAAATAAATSF